jgi:hypothetical protein
MFVFSGLGESLRGQEIGRGSFRITHESIGLPSVHMGRGDEASVHVRPWGIEESDDTAPVRNRGCKVIFREVHLAADYATREELTGVVHVEGDHGERWSLKVGPTIIPAAQSS